MNPNDPQGPSPLDGTGYPFRDVALFCDNECDSPDFRVEVRADTREEAFTVLRSLAAEAGWSITPVLDLCPSCRAEATR